MRESELLGVSVGRFILTVVGKDHPGIIAGIANTLYEYECNIQEVNQTVLSDEFAMILLLQPTREIDIQGLENSLRECCEALEMTYTLRPATILPGFSQRCQRIRSWLQLSELIGSALWPV